MRRILLFLAGCGPLAEPPFPVPAPTQAQVEARRRCVGAATAACYGVYSPAPGLRMVCVSEGVERCEEAFRRAVRGR